MTAAHRLDPKLHQKIMKTRTGRSKVFVQGQVTLTVHHHATKNGSGAMTVALYRDKCPIPWALVLSA
jgi:hypothetical protein